MTTMRHRATRPFEVRAVCTISGDLHRRFAVLRRRLEKDLGIRLAEDDLMEYVCEKAVSTLEDWERRTFPNS